MLISHRSQYAQCILFTNCVFHKNFLAGMWINLNRRSNIKKSNGYIKNGIQKIFHTEKRLWQLAFYKLPGVLKACKYFSNICQNYNFSLTIVLSSRFMIMLFYILRQKIKR